MNASVVMINYNGGESAAENARIVAGQAADEGMEFLVVDNNSSDGSDGLIRAAVPGANLVRELTNRGYAAAVNRGFGEAAGEVVIVLNADVVPQSGALRSLAEAALDDEFAILGGVLVDGSGVRSNNTARLLPRPADILREGLFLRPRSPRPDIADARWNAGGGTATVAVPVVSGAIMAVRRNVHSKLGPMDEDFFLYREDVEWCRRARALGLKVGVATSARFSHEGGASTRQDEGPAFAARVLSDFHYFCDIEGVPERAVRRRWLVRLAFRSLLYRADASLGVLGGRPDSRRRSAIYRILYENLRRFSWSPSEGQKCHPSRLAVFPGRVPREAGDDRPTVLFVVPDLDYGGVQRRVEFVTGGPLSRRYRFEVLCLRRSGPIGERISDRVAVHEVGVDRWTSPATWRRVRDYCALIEPDLVHSGTLPADVAALIGFGGRVPRVVTKVSVDRWMSPLVRLLDWAALRGAGLIYCVGDEVARVTSYLGRSGMLPAVIPNPPMIPIDEDTPAPFPEDSPVRIVCMGRLAPIKRVDVFLRLARALEDSHPGQFEFRVLGDGRERPSLEALARDLGLRDRVEFAGSVADVPRAMATADIVPLFSSGEGSPSTVMETIARGRVPVVLRAGGSVNVLPPELAECYVDRPDVGAYVEKILDIVARSGYYLERVHVAKEHLRARVRFHNATLDGFYGEALGRDDGRCRTKVLHIITRLIVGGAQENTIASVERVNTERYDSQLWIGPQTGSEGSLLADARSRGIVVRVLPNLVREINPRRDALALVQLVRLLRRGRFDIVHTHSSKAGILGRIAARIAGVPHIVHTVHGWGFHDRMNPLLKNAYATFEKVLQPWTRPLVSVSNKTTRVGLDEGIGRPDAYRLIRSGIPLTRFFPDTERGAEVRERLGLRADDIVVGSVGRLSPQKNPRDFVRVAELLLRDRENLRFVYVGDGPMRTEIERTLDSIGLSDRVLLLGVRDDVPDLLRAMDVFILTSLWEGLPRVVLQALATGLPVVAYDTAGIGEAVKEGRNGHLVEPGAVGEMVELLGRLVADASLRAAMGRAAVEELGTAFTEDGMIRDLENLYDELTEGEGDGASSAGNRPRESRSGFEGDDRGAS